MNYTVGTSGYSFADWIGPFYPATASKHNMFEHYVQHFDAVELNYTFYRMPAVRTLESLARRSPARFEFWVKANQRTTHEGDLSVIPEFVDSLQPLREAGKLAGVLLQFPQSFHRTVATRKFLGAALESFNGVHRAVEFRHHSWNHPATMTGLRDYNITLVVPDVPALPGLFRRGATATTTTGYLRLHSRNAERWYGSSVQRYDYDYSVEEMQGLLEEWAQLGEKLDKTYAFFNNCHGGQAARNAEAFGRILEQMRWQRN